MKHTFRAALAIVALGLLAAIVTVRADAPKTETVQFPNGTGAVSGFLAVPDKPGRYPALVVIHEWWGLTDWVKEQTQKLAEQGYIALAVDLYRGKVTADPEVAHELMRGLPQDRAVSDLKAAFAYLGTRKDVDRDHIGSIGWCMGGGFSLQLAIHEPRLAACVVNYGALPTDPNDIQQIGAPILGSFGADDRGITPSDVQAFEKTMRGMNRRIDVKIYDGAGHGFENSTNTAGYRPEAAADAWARTVAFLNKTMR
ncbi:MAG TPA: dienelactone hydrolase family protein [Candidatus Acidoferrales bacterium]|jgi:carboxymethylenebutenolidase|nr:dienelactone hydrolase family protein [Candidatus Acidoferrales bacterium]